MSCAFCGERILFGGVKQGELRFCNAICRSKGYLATAAAKVPESADSCAADSHGELSALQRAGTGRRSRGALGLVGACIYSLGHQTTGGMPAVCRQASGGQLVGQYPSGMVGLSMGIGHDAGSGWSHLEGAGLAPRSFATVAQARPDCERAARLAAESLRHRCRSPARALPADTALPLCADRLAAQRPP